MKKIKQKNQHWETKIAWQLWFGEALSVSQQSRYRSRMMNKCANTHQTLNLHWFYQECQDLDLFEEVDSFVLSGGYTDVNFVFWGRTLKAWVGAMSVAIYIIFIFLFFPLASYIGPERRGYKNCRVNFDQGFDRRGRFNGVLNWNPWLVFSVPSFWTLACSIMGVQDTEGILVISLNPASSLEIAVYDFG